MKSASDYRKHMIGQLEVLREYRANEQSRLLGNLLDTTIEHYRARLVDCPAAEIEKLRIAAQQLERLRDALTSEDLSRVTLTL